MKKFVIAAAATAFCLLSIVGAPCAVEAASVKIGSDTTFDGLGVKTEHKDVVGVDMSLGEIGTLLSAF